MKKISKLCVILLACICAISLIACSKSQKTKIGILQLLEHNSLNTISNAVKEELATLGYTDENSEIILQYGNADATQMNQIIADFMDKDVDVIVAVATGAAQAAMTAAEAGIPVIFAAASDPVGSNLLTNDKAPEGNITGVSDAIQPSATLELANQIKKINKLGFIVVNTETNAISTISRAKTYCDSVSISYAERVISSSTELEDAFNALLSEGCDAFYLADDNILAAAGPMGQYADLCIKAGVPLYTGVDSEVQDGGLFCAGITYTDLGHKVADMVDKVVKGTKVKDIPVDYMTSPINLYVNKTTLAALKLTLPEVITTDARYIEY